MHHSPWRDQYASSWRRSPIRSILRGDQRQPRARGQPRAVLCQPRGAAPALRAAQTRYLERWGRWYNLSTHLPWIGMRTAGSAARTSSTAAGSRTRRRESRADHGRCVGAGPVRDAQSAARAGEAVLIHRLGAGQIEARCRTDRVRAGHRVPVLWSATRCTATPRPRAPAPRRAVSRTSSASWRPRSASTDRPAATSAGCTSSSRARTSPSARAAPGGCPTWTSPAITARRWTRAQRRAGLELAMRIAGHAARLIRAADSTCSACGVGTARH